MNMYPSVTILAFCSYVKCKLGFDPVQDIHMCIVCVFGWYVLTVNLYCFSELVSCSSNHSVHAR